MEMEWSVKWSEILVFVCVVNGRIGAGMQASTHPELGGGGT